MVEQVPKVDTTAINHEPNYDAVFVLPNYPYPQKPVSWRNIEGFVERRAGRRTVEGKEGKKRLTTHPSGLLFDTRMKDIAASMLYEKGEVKTIVTMSRPIRSWMKESYAALMRQEIKGIVRKDLAIEETLSYDLRSELRAIPKIVADHHFTNIAILTDSVHAKRTKQLIENEKLFQNSNIIYDIREMESILTDKRYAGQRANAMTDIVTKLHHSPYWQFWKAREAIARHISPRFLSFASQKTR